MEKTFKKYWVVVKDDYPLLYTIRIVKKGSISAFLKGTSVTWEQSKKIGWECVKVDVNIKTVGNGKDI